MTAVLPEPIAITDPLDERVRRFALMRDTGLKEYGLIIIDSARVVQRAVKAGIKLVDVLGTADYLDRNTEIIALGQPQNIYQAPRQMMEQITGYRVHQGFMAVARRPDNASLLDLPRPLLIADGSDDATNVGSMARAAHAFGIRAMLTGHGACSPYIRRAIRVSMGSSFRLTVRDSENLIADVQTLKSQGVQIIGADNHPQAVSLPEFTPAKEWAIAIGNENRGLSPELRGLCDVFVRVPVASDIDSLNANAAAAVLCYSLTSSQPGGTRLN